MRYNSSKEIIKAPKRIGNYYYKKTKDIPDTFYQEIIELENEVQINPNPSMESVRKLGTLYKQAIEVFSGVSKQKVNFYSRKLQ